MWLDMSGDFIFKTEDDDHWIQGISDKEETSMASCLDKIEEHGHVGDNKDLEGDL